MHRPAAVPARSFAGFRFPPEVIMLAVRWYLRYGLSYRDVEELLAERGIPPITSRSTGGRNGSPPS
jgi:transposase-like protein